MHYFYLQKSMLIFFIYSIMALWIIKVDAQEIEHPCNMDHLTKQVPSYQDYTSLRQDKFLIDTHVVFVLSPDSQYSPTIAFDGTDYLAVWSDKRNGGIADICGTRINQSGVILDSAGFAISVAANNQYSPAIAFDGSNYLVVWEDYRNGNTADIYGARVSPSGMVLDTAGIAISVAVNTQANPAVAFDGTNYLVVWNDNRNGMDHNIYGARVNQAGTLLDSSGIAISTAGSNQISPALAFDSTNYLVVWEDYRNTDIPDIYCARVTQAGGVLDPAGIAISIAPNYQQNPSIIFGGANYMVAWEDLRNGGEADIYGARVNQTGTVLDPSGIAVSMAGNKQTSSSVAFNGTNYLVVWADRRSSSIADIYGTRINQAGTILDPSGIAISTATKDQKMPAIMFGVNNYLIIWQDDRNSIAPYYYSDIYGARINETGTVLDPSGIAVSTAANSQKSPAVAFDGINYLTVWEDNRNSDSVDIYGARINQFGTVLDPGGKAISNAANCQISPSIAFDGTNYCIAWEDYRNASYNSPDIYCARINQAGTVLDPSGIAVSTAAYGQLSPSIAFSDTNYLVAWEDFRSGGTSDIYGARVSQAGAVLDPSGIFICTAANNQISPALAFDGTNYLVAWADYRNGLNYHIYGSRINQMGGVLDPSGIAISTWSGQIPVVAFDGTNYLVVWEGFYAVYGARVNQAGTVLDPSGIMISSTANYQFSPAVAFDGTNYLVAWDDCRDGISYDIYGAHVSPAGVVLDTIALSTQPYNQITSTLAHGSGDQMFITYSGFTDFINTRLANTMRIWGAYYPLIAVEERNALLKRETSSYLQVYPNPVHGTCVLKYTIKEMSIVKVSVYDITGRLMIDLVNDTQLPGSYQKQFDMSDLTPGVYYAVLRQKTNTTAVNILSIK
jgi:hypothetical protein